MRSKWLSAALALVAVLVITTAASATTRGLITGRQIAPHAITSKHLVNHTIQAHDLSNGLFRSLRGERGPAGPPGAPGGLSGHAILTSAHHLESNGETTVNVTAPAGKVVLGGGVSSTIPGALVVEESYPSSPTTWTVTVYAWAGSTDFTAYAIVGSASAS